MYSNSEFKDLMKKVHPAYVTVSDKGNDKWKEARCFNVVVYPESLGERDIFECCEKLGVPCALSPLHDKDSTKDGEIKKAHWHVLASYKTKKNPYQWYVDCVNAFGEDSFNTIEIVSDLGAYDRYLIHLDSKDPLKYHYDIDSITDFNGFDSKKYLYECVGDTMSNVERIMDVIDSNSFIFFRELAIYLRENEPLLWASIVKDREVKNFVMNYIKSTEHMYTYSGKVEKGYTRIKMENGSEKVIFNRQIKESSVAI